MIELQEVRIGDNEVVLKDNRVKTSILPQSAKEITRDVRIQGNVIAEGPVFGNVISIQNGNVTFYGAVYANRELHISNDIAEPVSFKKAVASADSISAFVTSSRVVFGADINAVSVKLKNCFIAGSVFGTDVYLENCVVLGGVFASKNAVISSCIVGTFNGPGVELAGINYLLYPAAFTVEPLTFLPQTELYNLSLAHLGALYKGEKEAPYTGKIKMNLESDSLRTVLVGDNEDMAIVNSYSVSDRVLASDILNLEKLENHFLIGAGALNSQILKAYSLTKEDGSKTEELSLDNIADFFFRILNGTIPVQTLSGEISFEVLKKSFDGSSFNDQKIFSQKEAQGEYTEPTAEKIKPAGAAAEQAAEPEVTAAQAEAPAAAAVQTEAPATAAVQTEEMKTEEAVSEEIKTDSVPEDKNEIVPEDAPQPAQAEALAAAAEPAAEPERKIKYCTHCGAPNNIDFVFCVKCGKNMKQ